MRIGLLALLVLLAAAAAYAQTPGSQGSKIQSRDVDAVVAAGAHRKKFRLDLVEKSVTDAARGELRGVFVTLSDDVQKRFWWAFVLVPRGGDANAVVNQYLDGLLVVADGDRVMVWSGGMTQIDIGYGNEPFGRLDDVPGLAADALKRVMASGAGISGQSFQHRVDLSPLGRRFFDPPMGANAGRTSIETVEQFPDKWLVRIATVSGRRATVVLSPSLQLMSAVPLREASPGQK